MSDTHPSIRDSGALGVLMEQIRMKGDPDSELFNLLVARLACSKAQARGCTAGPESADWMQAEAEVHALHQRSPYRKPQMSASSPAAGSADHNPGRSPRPR